MPGFPEGLHPPTWMGDLTSKKLNPELAKNISVCWFCYPGSHDAATYKPGLADFSYQCQEKNLYDQMMTGQRAFDVRLAPAEGGKNFIAIHGIAKGTADDFSIGPHRAEDHHLASQIMRFAREHRTEIIIIKIRFDAKMDDEDRQRFSDTAWNLLGERLLESPNRDQKNPTYHHAVESNRNIILATPMPAKPDDHAIAKYLWKVGDETKNWLGDNDQLLWNEPTWQSGEIGKVMHSTEQYIEKNRDKLGARNKFWIAQLQLTPVLGQSITTFFKEGGSIRPKDLALGGGMGTHGRFAGSNKALREGEWLKKGLWRKHTSCLCYDFCDEETTGHIVAMNIPEHH